MKIARLILSVGLLWAVLCASPFGPGPTYLAWRLAMVLAAVGIVLDLRAAKRAYPPIEG